MTTSSRGSRGWPRPSSPRPKTGSPTMPIPRFAVEHVSQSSTAQATTKALPDHVRPGGKDLVATRPLTGLQGKIFEICCWALALARSSKRRQRRSCPRCRCCLHRCGDRWFRWLGNNVQWHALAIASALFPAADLARFSGSPATTGLPAPPTPRFPTASRATVTASRPSRDKRAFASLQQTAATTPRTSWTRRPLPWRPRNRIVQWAQGSCDSRRSSLGGECQLPPRRLFPLPSSLPLAEMTSANVSRGPDPFGKTEK